MTTAYPLAWPDGWPKTKRGNQRDTTSVFSRSRSQGGSWTFAETRDRLHAELRNHGDPAPVLSTNFEVGRNGPMEGRARRPDDQGVAIYFKRRGKPYVMAADGYKEAEGNMRSLTLALEAMRQLERHGGGVMLERAYEGFTALPPPGTPSAPPLRPWREVFGFSDVFPDGLTTAEAIDILARRYREHAKAAGLSGDLVVLNVAREAADRELRNAGSVRHDR